MINAKNQLPIAVRESRLRKSGEALSLDGISSGSFEVSGGTRYTLRANMRSTIGYVIIGYESPIGLDNASILFADLDSFADNVPEGTTVYFKVLDPATLLPLACGADDYLYVAVYG